MTLEASFQPYKLVFRFDARTSRGILREKTSYFLKVWDQGKPELIGIGEAGPLEGLSPDYSGIENELEHLSRSLCGCQMPASDNEINAFVGKMARPETPSVRFALETALYDLLGGAKKLLFPGKFTHGESSIPINGLIWMGTQDFMKAQVDKKIAQGYHCIKIKIGAIEFGQECALLDYIRKTYGPNVSIRVDANGAFTAGEVKEKLQLLSAFDIHSIEQPVKPGQRELMRELSLNAAIPVALDEELIGVTVPEEQAALLDSIRPQYIVLKPTLLGGLEATRNWIRLAKARAINWWITSTLESNIGLNALAQFTASLPVKLPQGLGTGMLYKNNLATNLCIKRGRLFYHP